MQKHASIMALVILGFFHVIKPAAPESSVPAQPAATDYAFHEQIKKLQHAVTVSWNPITTIGNKSLRLPTYKQYKERLHLAVQLFNTTGNTKLLSQTCALGYQNSWLKKNKALNVVVETVTFAPHLTALAVLLAIKPRLIKHLSPLRLLGRFHLD